MASKSPLPLIWQTLSHKVLSSVLVDHGAVFPVMNVVRSNTQWFPGKDSYIWLAVTECVSANVLPTVEAISVRVNGTVDPGYIQSIANQWNEEDNARLIYNARELKDIGILADVRRIGQDLARLEDPEHVIATVGYAENSLSAILSEKSDRDGSAQIVSESAWSISANLIPTGLDWFDELAGGLWTGMNTWIVAPYKAGKTTLMRNIVIHACDLGYPVDVFVAEGSREMFALDCQVMIATRIMLGAGIEMPHLRLSGTWVLRSKLQPKKVVLNDVEKSAIEQARKVWNSYPIRVWDSRDGITNLDILANRIKQSCLDHGCMLAFMDYSQLFGKGETLFERQSETALRVQQIAQNEQVAMVVLAQQNEETIKGRQSYSPGVKGGGDAHAAADFLFIPTRDEDSPMLMDVKLKLSRHTPTGSGQHIINPTSGLIMDGWYKTDRMVLSNVHEELLDEL